MNLRLNVQSTSLVVSALCLAVTGFARDAAARPLVYSQPPLFGNGNSFPSESNGSRRADDWVATTFDPLNLIRWWGTQAGPSASSGSFTLQVFSSAGGLPAGLLSTITIGNSYTRVATGEFDFNGRELYRYEAAISFNPIAGTTYWLSLYNDVAVSGNPGFLWHEGGGGNGSHAFRIGPTGSWNSGSGDMAFQLESIPAPGALALLGVAALATRRRR